MKKLQGIFLPLILCIIISCDKGNSGEDTKDVDYYSHLRNTSWVYIDEEGIVEKLTFETNKADLAYWLPRNYMNGYYICSTIQYVIENGIVYVVGYNSELMVNATLMSFSIKEIDDYSMITDDGISETEYFKVSDKVTMDVSVNNIINLSDYVISGQIIECAVSDTSVLEISKDMPDRVVAKAHGKSFVFLETTAGVIVLEVDVTGSLIEQCDYYYKSIYLHTSKMEQYFGKPDNLSEEYVIYNHGKNQVMLTPDAYGFIEGVLFYYECDSTEIKSYLDNEYEYYPEHELYAGNNLYLVGHYPSDKLVVYYPLEDE